MTADPESAIPLYFQIEQDLASLIARGTLAPGSQLPSEEELVRRYNVSRTTVRKAVQELERLGLIEIRRGRGTFVRPEKLSQEFTELTGFVEDMVALGLQPSARVLGTAPTAADESVARQLRVPIGTEVMQIRRLRMADGVAMSLDETAMPADGFGCERSWRTTSSTSTPSSSLLEGKYEHAAAGSGLSARGRSRPDPLVAEALRYRSEVSHPAHRAGLVLPSTNWPGGLREAVLSGRQDQALHPAAKASIRPPARRCCPGSPSRTNSINLWISTASNSPR